MKACANNTNAVTVNIVNNFDVVAIFENLNQEWIRKKSEIRFFGFLLDFFFKNEASSVPGFWILFQDSRIGFENTNFSNTDIRCNMLISIASRLQNRA